VVRRWLTYVTLFLAAGVLVGDLITLVYNVLAGELTLRFVLKVLIVGAIAGAIFWFYLRERLGRELAIAAAVAKQPGSTVPTSDPATGTTYEYIAGAARDYQLCATFETDTAQTGAGEGYVAPRAPAWDHPAGHYCFAREASARGG
jgi:hypothetical protein